MPTITKKQYNEYLRLCQQRDEGKILTLDGLHFICEANGTVKNYAQKSLQTPAE